MSAQTRQRLLAGAVLIGFLAIGGVVMFPHADDPVVGVEEGLRPWDLDPAPGEAARKVAFFERLSRWSEEPTPNQLAMDARYYDLYLDIDPVEHTVDGRLVALLTVDAAQSTEVDLDLADGLTVTEVNLNGSEAPYVHLNEIITVTLDRVYLEGESVEIEVFYNGTPPASYGAFGFGSHAGEYMIWTLSEPFGARSWWPCDDWSDDKADSVDLHITVPAGHIVASNGLLQDVTYGETTDTYGWHEAYPIATYLVSIACYPYAVWSDYYHYARDDSMEIQFFIFPGDSAATVEENLRVKDMITYFASVYGEYPFVNEKYGHAQFLWGGAMEHQTCTSTGAFYETIIAHELAHQWWGDMVTCADFHHIWLNEGFAVYSEALWLGDHYGPEGYWGKMRGTVYYGGGTIYVPDLNDWGRIFHLGLTYYKASWVVHMLRHVIGDEDFFQLLADYRTLFEYGSARTEDLQAIAESISGMDLSDFFQQWIYGEYFPVYAYEWDNAETDRQTELHLSIDQIQDNTGLFHMPIDVRVELEGGGTEEFVVDNAMAHEEYVLNLSAPATSVDIDPDSWILRRVEEPIVDPTFSEGILLVNGVDWQTYGELFPAYENKAFWGDLEISFWDCFPEPPGGYPSTLPEPLGMGRVPAADLGSFETVIWVGNNYNGDLDAWMNTSILPYLEAGGNVLLMARRGDTFLSGGMLDYLGITISGGTSVYEANAVHTDLNDIESIGQHSYCIHFSDELSQPTSMLLYVDYAPTAAIGVLRAPDEGGTHNPYGGRFAFLSGRPYRWDYSDLSTNVETIINSLMRHPADAADEGVTVHRLEFRLASPAVGRAHLQFSLPEAAPVEIGVYDAQGRRVSQLARGVMTAGEHNLTWDGRLESGGPAPAGIYYVRLQTTGEQRIKSLLLVR